MILSLNKCRAILLVLVIIMLCLIGIGGIIGRTNSEATGLEFMFAGLAFLVPIFFILAKFWRCCECGKSLPTHLLNTDFEHCPYCNKNIFDQINYGKRINKEDKDDWPYDFQ